MVASRKLTFSQTGGETDTKINRAMAAKAKKSPGNAGDRPIAVLSASGQTVMGPAAYLFTIRWEELGGV